MLKLIKQFFLLLISCILLVILFITSAPIVLILYTIAYIFDFLLINFIKYIIIAFKFNDKIFASCMDSSTLQKYSHLPFLNVVYKQEKDKVDNNSLN